MCSSREPNYCHTRWKAFQQWMMSLTGTSAPLIKTHVFDLDITSFLGLETLEDEGLVRLVHEVAA
jgi:hypothetical protein